MRLLLDENVPCELKAALVGHACSTVQEMGWASTRNGQLLTLVRSQFEAFVTLDRGIQFQHNHVGHRLIIAILRVPNSRAESVLNCTSSLLRFLESAAPGEVRELRAHPE